MRYRGPEKSYISDIDYEGRNQEEELKISTEAEQAVLNFLKKNFPDDAVRHATEKEDSGEFGENKGSQAIDIVLSKVKKKRDVPSLVQQVTTGKSLETMQKKMKEMQERPFVRLEGMSLDDVAAPKTLIFLDPELIKRLRDPNDLEAKEELDEKVVSSSINSLKFALLKTKNPKEQALAKDWLEIFEKIKKNS